MDPHPVPLPPGGDASAPPRRRRSSIALARTLAIVVDAIQIVGLPLFGEGFASPWNDALDLVIAAVMIRLLGFHVAFLPAFLAELVPAFDLFPTWTIAVAYVTRGRRDA